MQLENALPRHSADEVVRLARQWVGTPYHHQASKRGAGADCLGLVRGVWRELYGYEAEAPPPYRRDWAEASGRETMLEAASRHLRRSRRPKPRRRRARLPPAPRHSRQARCDPDRRGNDDARHGRGAAAEVALSPWWRRRIAGVFAFPGTISETMPACSAGGERVVQQNRKSADGDACIGRRRLRHRRRGVSRRREGARRDAHRRRHRLADRRPRRLHHRPGAARRAPAQRGGPAPLRTAHHRLDRRGADPARLRPRAARRAGDLGDAVRGGGVDELERRRQGSERLGGSATTTQYRYFANFAVALSEGEISGIGRIWADGREIDRSQIVHRVYTGSETQEADSLIVAREGADTAPAYRGTAYVVFERLALATSATGCRSSPSRSTARSRSSARRSAPSC